VTIAWGRAVPRNVPVFSILLCGPAESGRCHVLCGTGGRSRWLGLLPGDPLSARELEPNSTDASPPGAGSALEPGAQLHGLEPRLEGLEPTRAPPPQVALDFHQKNVVAKDCNDFSRMAQKPQMVKKALEAQNISFARAAQRIAMEVGARVVTRSRVQRPHDEVRTTVPVTLPRRDCVYGHKTEDIFWASRLRAHAHGFSCRGAPATWG
jgi:hypothetical protein